jgi:hypothetical protein
MSGRRLANGFRSGRLRRESLSCAIPRLNDNESRVEVSPVSVACTDEHRLVEFEPSDLRHQCQAIGDEHLGRSSHGLEPRSRRRLLAVVSRRGPDGMLGACLRAISDVAGKRRGATHSTAGVRAPGTSRLALTAVRVGRLRCTTTGRRFGTARGTLRTTSAASVGKGSTSSRTGLSGRSLPTRSTAPGVKATSSPRGRSARLRGAGLTRARRQREGTTRCPAQGFSRVGR